MEKPMQIRNVNEEQKRKAMFVLKTQGKTLSETVRNLIGQYAKEFDEKYGKED